jgi:NADH dehydrogenase [ubiquinone] 1 alpha subcomplex assembly factor 7
MTETLAYDPDARRDTPLALKIKSQLRERGSISLCQYMDSCLLDPEHGYYTTRAGIGAAGDFITAPEISQIFGELIGLWCATVWQQMGEPSKITLIELGPGRGTMLKDIVRAARVVPKFLAAIQVRLVETSAPLAALQRQTLAGVGVPVEWSKRAFDPHPDTPFILLANEYLDAWPVEHWRYSPAGDLEHRRVILDARDALQFDWRPFPLHDIDWYRRYLPEGVIDWFHSAAPAATILETHNTLISGDGFVDPFHAVNHSNHVAAALIIDYGHGVTQPGETLQAVRAHKPEHPLTSPGEADLTAHVDFREVRDMLRKLVYPPQNPIQVIEPLITQAEFLASLGIVERAQKLIAANPSEANTIETAIARLIAPNGMGTRFKVMGVRSPQLPPLPGFPLLPRRP